MCKSPNYIFWNNHKIDTWTHQCNKMNQPPMDAKIGFLNELQIAWNNVVVNTYNSCPTLRLSGSMEQMLGPQMNPPNKAHNFIVINSYH